VFHQKVTSQHEKGGVIHGRKRRPSKSYLSLKQALRKIEPPTQCHPEKSPYENLEKAQERARKGICPLPPGKGSRGCRKTELAGPITIGKASGPKRVKALKTRLEPLREGKKTLESIKSREPTTRPGPQKNGKKRNFTRRRKKQRASVAVPRKGGGHAAPTGGTKAPSP